MLLRNPVDRRQGAIAPLTAVLAVFILGMVAFAIDTGWLVLTESELQNAADSAALAGAQKLMDGLVAYQLPGQSASQQSKILDDTLAAARTSAKAFAALNGAGGVSSLTLLDNDIEFGFTDASGSYTAYNGTNPVFPNTCKVLMRRDASANGALNLFFAPAIGTKSRDLTATASSTCYSGTVTSFSGAAGILPVTFDTYYWDNFLKNGTDPDGNKTYDANGRPVLQIYPSVKDTGNFGILSLDDSHNGTSEIRSWIDNGVPASDIQTLKDRNLIPLEKHNPLLWDWNGDTGFRASMVMDINNHVGETFVLPLFKPFQQSTTTTVTTTNKNGKTTTTTVTTDYEAGVGTGSHYSYNIVAFVAVKIVEPAARNRDIRVQPAAVIEPNAVFQNLQPASGTSGLNVIYSVPKLTR